MVQVLSDPRNGEVIIGSQAGSVRLQEFTMCSSKGDALIRYWDSRKRGVPRWELELHKKAMLSQSEYTPCIGQK